MWVRGLGGWLGGEDCGDWGIRECLGGGRRIDDFFEGSFLEVLGEGFRVMGCEL